jgi:broad specificity phosphatase PhoE
LCNNALRSTCRYDPADTLKAMKTSATVLLIRHATNPYVGKGLTGWLPGVSLDAKGRDEADRLAARLEKIPIAALYSSPLERAIETAQPTARLKNLEIIGNPDLGEIHFGEWQGKSFSEIETHESWNRFNAYRSATRAPGGELMLETQARIVRGLHRIADSHPGQTVAAFSHADAIKAALMHFLGIPLDFHLRLEILPASITIVEFRAHFPVVRAINLCEPLDLYDL